MSKADKLLFRDEFELSVNNAFVVVVDIAPHTTNEIGVGFSIDTLSAFRTKMSGTNKLSGFYFFVINRSLQLILAVLMIKKSAIWHRAFTKILADCR